MFRSNNCDWEKGVSILDILLPQWPQELRSNPLMVVRVAGDQYGGCQIELEVRST